MSISGVYVYFGHLSRIESSRRTQYGNTNDSTAPYKDVRHHLVGDIESFEETCRLRREVTRPWWIPSLAHARRDVHSRGCPIKYHARWVLDIEPHAGEV